MIWANVLMIWASRFAAQRFAHLWCAKRCLLASGYPLHHPHAPAAHAGGSAAIPLALDASQKSIDGSAKRIDGS